MIKKILIISILLLTGVFAFADEAVESEEVSGLVRVVRSSPETEIFFYDRKDSVIVPSFHPEHNKILKMSLDSIKNKKPITLSVNPVSRRLISKPAVKSVEEPETVKPTSSKPASGGFKEIPSGNTQ